MCGVGWRFADLDGGRLVGASRVWVGWFLQQARTPALPGRALRGLVGAARPTELVLGAPGEGVGRGAAGVSLFQSLRLGAVTWGCVSFGDFTPGYHVSRRWRWAVGAEVLALD